MANDLTSLTTGRTQLPAAFVGKKAANVFAGQRMETGAEGLTGSYGILKFAGKVWTLQYKGESYTFMRTDPSDPGPRSSVDVVVVRSAENLSKTYYPAGFKPGSRDRPTCWSNDGKRPDPQVPTETKQAHSCGICPMNVFGSAITDDGKKAKACSDAKRLAVVLHPDLATSVLGAPLSEAVLLRLPAASLNDFGNFGSTMDRQGYALPTFVSRITFDPTKNYPRLVFQPHPTLPPLSEEEAAVANIIRHDQQTLRIVSDNVVSETPEDVQRAGVAAQQHQQETVLRPVTAAVTEPLHPVLAKLQETTQVAASAVPAVIPITSPSGPAEVIQMPIIPRMTPQQQAEAMVAKATKSAEAPTTTTTDAAMKALDGEVLPPVGDDLEEKINAQVQALLGG